MGMTFEINTAKEMCDLMSGNIIPSEHNDDLISRKSILDRLDDFTNWCKDERLQGCLFAMDVIKEMPSANPRTGKWRVDIDKGRLLDYKRFYCSACGGWNTYGKSAYCPNCGAEMEAEDDTN